jgi:hypothetical protein
VSDPSRLLPVAVALFLGLSPLEAAATSALFHFDDFDYDYGGPFPGPLETDPDAPYTYVYGCDGKPYCTASEVVGTNSDSEGIASRISTVRNGIGLEIGRQGFGWSVNYEGDGWVDPGNDPQDFTLFLLDFDTPLQSFSADISRPRVLDPAFCDDECPPGEERSVYSLIQVYLWSDPGGTGDLVGHLTITPDDYLEVINNAGHIALTSDQPFRSVNFGQSLSDDPDCIVRERGGQSIPCGFTSPTRGDFFNGYVIGNILVSTVPEPSTALLLGLGLVGLAARSRSRGAC